MIYPIWVKSAKIDTTILYKTDKWAVDHPYLFYQ